MTWTQNGLSLLNNKWLIKRKIIHSGRYLEFIAMQRKFMFYFYVYFTFWGGGWICYGPYRIYNLLLTVITRLWYEQCLYTSRNFNSNVSYLATCNYISSTAVTWSEACTDLGPVDLFVRVLAFLHTYGGVMIGQSPA